ncbi:hypothetical protein AB0M23_13355 [Streptomyces sp. NPDC052077]|uniref:hypothetical protein n=1 Tax=Streptomyces sp. NPDC052077 TaxID=3154757 RepID=UPI0034124E1C
MPQPKRWRVEQTCGISVLRRYPVRGHEHRPSSPASRGHRAMSHLMPRRPTGTDIPTWRVAEAEAPEWRWRHTDRDLAPISGVVAMRYLDR